MGVQDQMRGPEKMAPFPQQAIHDLPTVHCPCSIHGSLRPSICLRQIYLNEHAPRPAKATAVSSAGCDGGWHDLALAAPTGKICEAEVAPVEDVSQ